MDYIRLTNEILSEKKFLALWEELRKGGNNHGL